MLLFELVEYPDSGKLGVIAGTQGGRAPVSDAVRRFTRLKDGADCWEGES